ncbi:NfeD family protein [Ancylobacter novellus]|nr:NfeD family protein [Ancylobacter novellus]
MAALAEALAEFWLWLIAAGLLMIAELVVPGAYLIWFGVAALATSIAVALVPMGWQAQLVLFAVAALFAVVIGRMLARSKHAESDRPFLNRRTDALVGRDFVLHEAIKDGVGQIRVDDTIWRVTGPDCPAGTRVVVAGAEGATLRVTPAGTP